MRLFFLCLLVSVSYLSPKAQTHLPVAAMNYAQWMPFPTYSLTADSLHSNQKWFFSPYSSISAGFGYFNGAGASFVSAPVGLQLTRELNNNVYAFAGVSVAPTFFSFNRAFTDPAVYKSYPGGYPSNAYSFGMNSGIEMGLMYINDAKTFSISGSIGVERSSFPVYQNYPTNRNNQRK
jgi:hypothetical protein